MTRLRMTRSDRRAQLVAVAEQVFVEQGYGAASMDDVAERAGVTKPVLYDHFGSKDGLLAAVMGDLGAELMQQTADAIVDATTPEQALEQGLRAYFGFVDEHAAGWSLLLREVSPGTLAAQAADEVRLAQVASIALLVQVHLPGQDEARATAYAHIISGAAERLSAVRLTDPALTADVAVRLLMEGLWVGLSGLQDGRRWEQS